VGGVDLLRCSVRREYVLEDSFHQMVLRRPDELKVVLGMWFLSGSGSDFKPLPWLT
jgi:hypothetical protein